MSPNPTIQVPDSPIFPNRSAVSSPVVSKTPKSMLRNLFVWKKPSPSPDNQIVMPPTPHSQSRPPTSLSTQQPTVLNRKPSFSHRSRSDTSVPQRSKTRSKSRRRSRSRCRAIWDPPPLFQAYNQAFMHDTLQIPNKGFLDWLPRNTSSRSSGKHSDSADDERDDYEVSPISHRRSMSDPNNSSLCKKLFFLFENGHILQYKEDGSHDRLPERVLELSRESVAFASDAVAGQHWVLEICPSGHTDQDVKTSTSKLSWSRMTLKTPDTKRLAERLLLVFDSPDILHNWMWEIRKQIEHLGGLEYQPDIPPVPQPDSKRPALRHASSEYLKRKNGGLPFSRSSSALPLKTSDHSAHEKELPELPAILTYKRSVSERSMATSSVATTTSLEQFRESYSGSSTAGTAISSGVSATSLSPTIDTFPSSLSPVLGRDSKFRTSTSRTPTSPLHNSEERTPSPDILTMPDCNNPPPVLRNLSDDYDAKCQSNDEPVSRRVPQLVVGNFATDVNRHDTTFTMNTSPVMGYNKSPCQNQQNSPATYAETESSVDIQETSGLRHQHVSRPSLGSSAKGSYGLFPKKLALDVKIEPLIMPEKNNVPGLLRNQATDHLEISASPITPVASNFAANLFARANTSFTSKRPAAVGLSHLLAPTEVEQPMRSPAVTDLMLETNFGMTPGGTATQPATPIEIRVPDFNDINIDQSLLASVKAIEGRTTSPSSSSPSRVLASRRSLPNFHHGSNSVISAPMGPPPSGPLPAVPPVNEGRASRNSTPSKRASTHSSSNRRASAKSISSAKKMRSPAPSFSFPASQTKIPASPTRAPPPPPPFVAQNKSSNTSPISPQVSEPAITIGQVSVVPIPPPVPQSPKFPQHKKSFSTSSVKSDSSRKTHRRTPSSKSTYSSIVHLPPFTHLISPPCGVESDSEYESRGCFGVAGPRSST